MDNILDLLRNSGISPRKVSTGKHGEEYHSSCPVCGDGSPRSSTKGASDRFQVWPTRRDGGYFTCRQCGIHGDNIQFVRDTEGLSYPEACAALGITMANTVARPASSTPRPPLKHVQQFQPHTYDMPCAEWLAKAQEFVLGCHEQLMGSAPALKWLADRGITKESAKKYLLGYNPGNNGGPLYKSREAWGLPAEKNDSGKDKPLWLPVGLVVPMLNEEGQVIQARIRRTEEDRASFLPELKYYVIPGGCQATMVLNRGAKCFVPVEAGLDAILVAQEAEGLDTGAITTWNASAKPDAATCALLEKAMKILVALDADKGGDKGSIWWLETFRQAKRHAPSGGKDPGEAYTAGANIRAWLLAGLPPAITLFATAKHAATPAACSPAVASNTPVPTCLSVSPAGDLVTDSFGLAQEGRGEDLPVGGDAGQVAKGDVERLYGYMCQFRVQIHKDSDGVQINNLGRCPELVSKEIENLIWQSDDVNILIDRHPSHLITAANIMGAA
ncbi:MAG: alpha helicase [Proteobacteria bacterium]|nr:alpha helicase [Pseudomonadota bacterium]MBU1640094.1 alpha helicase [Pseudomonadota bacterium]